MVAAAFFWTAANAQRADDNAATSASDAFGTVVGNRTIGLYSESNARGFSPMQAGNVRIEGLYFDQQRWTARQGRDQVGIYFTNYDKGAPAPCGQRPAASGRTIYP
ncbi:MAG: hypothetical protein ACREFT_10045 [Acetobacteraceae bacterium]